MSVSSGRRHEKRYLTSGMRVVVVVTVGSSRVVVVVVVTNGGSVVVVVETVLYQSQVENRHILGRTPTLWMFRVGQSTNKRQKQAAGSCPRSRDLGIPTEGQAEVRQKQA